MWMMSVSLDVKNKHTISGGVVKAAVAVVHVG